MGSTAQQYHLVFFQLVIQLLRSLNLVPLWEEQYNSSRIERTGTPGPARQAGLRRPQRAAVAAGSKRVGPRRAFGDRALCKSDTDPGTAPVVQGRRQSCWQGQCRCGVISSTNDNKCTPFHVVLCWSGPTIPHALHFEWTIVRCLLNSRPLYKRSDKCAVSP